jgi:thiol:disulfide interchange protein DsbD
MRILVLLLSFLFSLSVFAQSSWKELTSGKLILETSGVPADDPFEVGLLLHLKKGWHTYWKNSGDSGAGPRFEWLEGKGEKDPRYPAPVLIEDAGIVTFGYEDQVLFVFKHPGLSKTTTLKLKAEWLVCKDVCLPAEDVFEVQVAVQPLNDITPTPERALFDRTRQQWPLPVEMSVDVQGKEARYSIPLKENPKSFSFFPFQSLPFSKLKPTSFSYSEGRFYWTMPLKGNPSRHELGGLIRLKEKNRQEIFEPSSKDLMPLQNPPSVGEDAGAVPAVDLWVLLLAFVGGLILNLMPCVFPILSMKLFAVVKVAGSDPKEARCENLSYVLGVIVTFLGLGILLSSLRQAGTHVGWGFQLQSPLFVGALILLFVVLALEMLGYFTFDLLDPSKGQSLTRKKGFWGAFFTGVLAVVVASPCSAPFMGAAVGAALARPGWWGTLVFFFLGLGLSSPYLILAVAPKLLSWLPKPGRWMNVLKEVMAFPLLLTAVWLLWLFNQIASPQALLVLGATLVALVFSLWVSSFSRKLAWALTLASLLGFVFFHLSSQAVSSSSSAQSEMNRGEWMDYSEELLAARGHEIFFVNMTAEWCLTCKVNEKLVFDQESVKKTFEELKIKRIKGDWTKRDPKITAFLDRFHRAGVPFYVVFSDKHPEGEVLSEVLTPRSLIQKLKENVKD